MSAELLKAAMNDAGVDVDELADRIQVDVRTVRRWVNGGIPYARHQTRVARALNTTARDLWPEAHPPQPDSDRDTSDDDAANGPDLAGVFGSGDVVAVYHGRDDPRVPEWQDLLDRAQTRVDLVDLTLARRHRPRHRPTARRQGRGGLRGPDPRLRSRLRSPPGR